MGAPIEHNASPQFRLYNFRTLTWRGASILAQVPFDTIRGLWGTMGPPNVLTASLDAMIPGVPTFISGFNVAANANGSDNSATIRILGRMQNGYAATCLATARLVVNYMVFGY